MKPNRAAELLRMAEGRGFDAGRFGLTIDNGTSTGMSRAELEAWQSGFERGKAERQSRHAQGRD